MSLEHDASALKKILSPIINRVEVAEPETEPTTAPTTTPAEPERKEKPHTPIKPTPGIQPKPKALMNRDIDLFLSKRDLTIPESVNEESGFMKNLNKMSDDEVKDAYKKARADHQMMILQNKSGVRVDPEKAWKKKMEAMSYYSELRKRGVSESVNEPITETMYVLSVQLRLEKYLKEWLKKHMQEVIFDEAMHGATEYKVRIDTDLSREDLRKLILSDYPIDELPEIQGMRESINEAKPTFKGVHPEKKEWIKTGDEQLNQILPQLSDKEQKYLQTIASESYAETVKRIEEYTGIKVAESNIPSLAYLLMQTLEQAKAAEKKNTQRLEEMALELIFSIPEFKIVEEAYNNDELGFDIKLAPAELQRLTSKEDKPEEESELSKEEELNMDLAVALSDENEEDLKRRFANLLISGGSINKLYLFNMTAEKLAAINPSLPTYYGILASVAQLGYWVTPFGIEQAAAEGDVTSAGSEEVIPKGDKYIIKVRGTTFPYMVHELVKGVYEYLALDPSQQISMQKANVEDETKDIIAGPGVYKTIVSYIPNDRQELIPVVQKELTKLRPDEIRDVLAKNEKGQQIMNNLISHATTEWEKYQKQKEEYVK